MRLLKLLRLTIIILLFVSFFAAGNVRAKTAGELQKEIDAKQQELTALNEKLKLAESQLKSQEAAKSKSLSEIEAVKLELDEVTSQLAISELEQQKLKNEIELKALQKEDLTKKMDGEITDAYINWKTDDITRTIFGSDDIVKMAVYQTYVAEQSRQHILGISTELDKLNKANSEYEMQIGELEKQKTAFAEKKTQLENKINELNSAIAANTSSKGTLSTQITGVVSEISDLTAQQKAIQNQDNSTTNNSSTTGTKEIISGQIYFEGSGRDARQGHGVGMSQYGAHGMAKAGKTFSDILKFYYTGVTIADYPESQQITIIYCIGKANSQTPPNCSGGSTTKRISLTDYLGGLGEMPESWPIEARKAQMVAARTYALRYTNNGDPNRPICLTTSCQVSYINSSPTDANFMHDGDYDVAQATQGKVILYNGAFISAVYSSDNNQGYGTANNDTVWTNGFDRLGTPYPYLRSVNDNSLATKTQWTNWAWRTNSYSLDQLNSLFDWAAANYKTGGSNTFLKNLKSTVGKINAFSFDRDPSKRVTLITVYGDKGSKKITGWLFKAVWNSWIWNVRPSGQEDYIYSSTLFMKTGQ